MHYTIDELIEFHEESDLLDFKQAAYHAGNKHELLKDVLASANGKAEGDRFIIIGLKKSAEGTRFFAPGEPEDAAHLQQYIYDNIEPDVHITYSPYRFEDHELLVLTIKAPFTPPYLAKKQVQLGTKTILKPGDMLIRKGTTKRAVSRADLDQMYRTAKPGADLADFQVIFFENRTREMTLQPALELDMPSNKEALKIRQVIGELEQRIARDPSPFASLNPTLQEPDNPYGHYTVPELEDLQARIKTVFAAEDSYYLYEQRANQIQIRVRNNGGEMLKNALVELHIPDTVQLTVVDRLHQRPHQNVFASLKQKSRYPSVRKTDGKILVQQPLGNVRHHVPIDVFPEPLRIYAPESSRGAVIPFVATLHADNLSLPVVAEMRFVVV